MTIHLDTCFLIDALAGSRPQADKLEKWLTVQGEESPRLAISAPAWCEFLCGPLVADPVADVRRLLGEPIPFGEREAELAADLFNHSGRRRGTLADCQIAAVAISHKASLATSNRGDFLQFKKAGLQLAD